MYVEVKFEDLDADYKKVLSASIIENTLVHDTAHYAYIKITKEFLNGYTLIVDDPPTMTNGELLKSFLNNPTAYKVKVGMYTPAVAVDTSYLEVTKIVENAASVDRKITNPDCSHPLAIIRSGTSSLFAHL